MASDVDMNPMVIFKVINDLAYRTPQGDKPLGHIVLDRDQAQRLVDEWQAQTDENERLWDSIHKLYAYIKPDAPTPDVPLEDLIPKKKAPGEPGARSREASNRVAEAARNDTADSKVVYVVTGNAYPVKAFRTRASAEADADRRSEARTSSDPLILWSVKEFTIED